LAIMAISTKYSILLPTLNEGDALAPLLERLLALPFCKESEILILDSGSWDNTRDTYTHFSQNHKNIKWVGAPHGKSAALRVGFAKAKGELIFFMDSDLQYMPEELTALKNAIDAGADVVCTKRQVVSANGHVRRALSLFFSQLVGKKLLNLPVSDPQSGMKAIRASLLKKMKLSAKYWDLDLQLIMQAGALGAKIAEVPITFESREGGQAKADIFFTGGNLLAAAGREIFKGR